MHLASSKAIANEVRLSFVVSLYQQRGTLFAGMAAHVITALAIHLRIDDPFYLYAALALFLVWLIRNMDMQAFDKADTDHFSLSDTLMWERRYVVGSFVTCSLLGTISGHALVVSQDPFAELVSIAVTLASMISVVGRNFGSRLNVDMIVMAACLPITVGLLMAADPFMALMAVLMLPLFLTTRSMANSVREFLFNSVTAERKTADIAELFDTALNNMPNGLFMLDGYGRIEVANLKAREFFHINPEVNLTGRALKAALRLGARNGLIDKENFAETAKKLEELVSGRVERALLQMDANTWLQFSARRRGEKGVVLTFEDVSMHVKAEQRILHMARFDNLTGLPNRPWFRELVAKKLAVAKPKQNMGLAVLDIDDFKNINDTMGHVSGDKLLSAIANRLKSYPENKLVSSRFGGDEFVVFMPDIADADELRRVMGQIFETLRGVYVIDGHKLFIGVTGGVALAGVSDLEIEELHIQADLALFEAKQRDKDHWCLFEQAMDQEYNRKQRLKLDLREAIQKNTMGLVYQPMFTPEGTRVAGAEALSRWAHPELGPISPGLYIPLAEEMGIISDLTVSVVRQAIKDCASWPEDMFVSVNLSAHDLGDREIVSVIADAVKEHNLAPHRLQLEVTESGLMGDLETARMILSELRDMGMIIAIDDFGTGYSSLSYLDMLPLNKVKIDRSFISNLIEDERKLILLRGIVNMARELELDIVVEGVETNEQLALIQENSCADLIQGFIFGAPMPESAFSELASKLSSRANPAPKKRLKG